jgi:16S rRNA (guanine966-N2)-methyltransferase
MRIISGINKGRKINAPKKLPVRPTTDQAKEALFNIISNSYFFSELSVLDLFTGTGNISYEFASRGSKKITCVDSNKSCIKFVEKISNDLSLNLNIIKSDVYTYLKKNNAN